MHALTGGEAGGGSRGPVRPRQPSGRVRGALPQRLAAAVGSPVREARARYCTDTSDLPAIDADLAQVVSDELRGLIGLPYDEAAQQVVDLWLRQYEPRTSVALVSKWRKYFDFCKRHDRVAVPASLATVMLFVGYMSSEGRVAAHNFAKYLSAVRTLHSLLMQEPPPPPSHPMIQGLITAAGKLQRTDEPQLPRQPLPCWAVERALVLTRACRPRQFVALMYVIVKFVMGVRAATLRALRPEHVRVDGVTVCVDWVSEKQTRSDARSRRVAVAFPRAPVVAQRVQQLLDLIASTGSGRGTAQSVFTWAGEDLADRPESVFREVFQVLQVVQPLDGTYSGHSTRSGFAAGCRALGIPVEVISQIAGWAIGSPVVFGYLRFPVEPTPALFALFAGLVPTVQQRRLVDLFGNVLISSDGLVRDCACAPP